MGGKLTLVVMAAGMGSRYGGLKQIDPVGPHGQVIMEYSIFDAVRAGFTDVVVVLKPEMSQDFARCVGDRVSGAVPLTYAYQEVGNLPDGYAAPAGRVKPWGTAQAVLAAKDEVAGPFAVINADDYYGPDGFRILAEFLQGYGGGAHDPAFGRMTREDEGMTGEDRWAMVAYRIENTLTRHGSVSRGVCQIDGTGHLIRIDERTRIVDNGGGAAYNVGDTWVPLPPGTQVSMNLWGFTHGFIDAVEQGFPRFLDERLPVDPLTCEYQLPVVVQSMIDARTADVSVLTTQDRWHGITYQEDKPDLVRMFAAKQAQGDYPADLWGPR